MGQTKIAEYQEHARRMGLYSRDAGYRAH